MHPARIAELLQPFLSPISDPGHSESGRRPGAEPAVLSQAQFQHISTYIDVLLRWNARINLTAIRDPEEIVTRHFGESLFAARHLFPKHRDHEWDDIGSEPAAPEGRALADDQRRTTNGRAADRVADLGSGAGFPGIPIKLWAPHIALTLIESNHKKATFLREVTRTLTLTNVNIQNNRAEALPQAAYDVVILRAVEQFAETLPVAVNLLAPSGRLALLISSSQIESAHSILPDLAWHPPVMIPCSHSRNLLVASRAASEGVTSQP